MVRDALIEREVLLHSAPHLIQPMAFVLPHHKKLRPWWLIRLGLFLYDRLGGRQTLPRSRGIAFAGTKIGQPLKLDFKKGFLYADGWVDDARLVVAAAMDAREKGAHIMTRTEVTQLRSGADDGLWHAEVRDTTSGATGEITAKMIVNASGPWIAKTLQQAGNGPQKYNVRLIKGSHILVPRLYMGEHSYILQNDDGRVVFVIPYEEKYTLIGTTDVEYTGDLEEVRIDVSEAEYLCKAASRFLRNKISLRDVVWTYSGVRPLLDDGSDNASSITRDYLLDIEQRDSLPILNVYGGKLTAFRKLAEEAANAVAATLMSGSGPWTAKATLPGGDQMPGGFEPFFKNFRREYAWLPEGLALRYARSYGTRARQFLKGARRLSDLGAHYGDNVYAAEIAHLVKNEWAMTLEDILWRRTKLGLHVSDETAAAIEQALAGFLHG